MIASHVVRRPGCSLVTHESSTIVPCCNSAATSLYNNVCHSGLGLCHGATTISEPQRGVGDHHTEGASGGYAAPAPRSPETARNGNVDATSTRHGLSVQCAAYLHAHPALPARCERSVQLLRALSSGRIPSPSPARCSGFPRSGRGRAPHSTVCTCSSRHNTAC